MNPLHPHVQDFMVGLVTDAVRDYDIDGVQLDDHFAAPNGFDMLDLIPAKCKHHMMEQFAWKVIKMPTIAKFKYFIVITMYNFLKARKCGVHLWSQILAKNLRFQNPK